MKILVIDEWFPYPMDSGKKIRTFNLVSNLAKNNDITYICFKQDTEDFDNEAIPERVKIIPVPDKRTTKGSAYYFFKVFLNLFQKEPFSVKYSYLSRMEKELGRLLRAEEFDLIICEWTPYAHYLKNVIHSHKILMAHNVEYQQWQRMYEVTFNPLKKILFYNQWQSMVNFEKEYFKIFDTIIAVSDLDKKLIHKMSNYDKVFVVENGVDLDYFKPQPTERKDRVIFTASMDAFANQNASVYFAEKIFPLLKRKLPSMEFYIVGRAPSQAIIDLGKTDGITVTGAVVDVRPYIAQSSVAVVPILAGGGSRLKILEAMAMGIPVVSTSVGAEGLEVENGKDILITDSEEQFVEQILQCHNNSNLRTRLTLNALELVKNKYGWEYLGGKLNQYLARTCLDTEIVDKP
jgi:sugar transferase (PEP-CTERM/EpsH1 system associated)